MTDNSRVHRKDWENLVQSLDNSSETVVPKEPHPMAITLAKRRNTAMGAEKLTQRALTGCPATALQHLTREWAIACVLRLAAKHPVNAESIIITLTEY